jgi:hypothetical protein
VYGFVHHHFNFGVLPKETLTKFCHYLAYMLPSIKSRERAIKWADWILKDDALILKDGSTMKAYEIAEAAEERGACFLI